MMIKLIALDLDGTTLNSQGKLTSTTEETLNKAAESGIHVVIATGRARCSLPEEVVSLPGIEYAITSNGAAITDLRSEELIYEDCIDPQVLEQLYLLLKKQDFMIEVFIKGKAYVEKYFFENLEAVGMSEHHMNYVKRTRQPFTDVLNLMIRNKEHIENININFSNQQDRKRMGEKLIRFPNITVTSSSEHNIEIGGATTNKASALRELCGKLGVHTEHIMACGDSPNDEEMMRVAGMPVAMGNAKESIKRMAKYITSTNDEDGVAAAIKKLALK